MKILMVGANGKHAGLVLPELKKRPFGHSFGPKTRRSKRAGRARVRRP
jgi:hypothetical protein